MKSRLYITGEINIEMYEKVSKFLLRQAAKGTETVDIRLSSEGGNVYDALAIYDSICSYKKNMEIEIVAIGLVASAATLILAAGSYRFMNPNSWVMVHEDSVEFSQDQKVSYIERAALHSRKLENQWNALLAKHTKLTAEEWAQINKHDTYLTADECLACGLIDEII